MNLQLPTSELLAVPEARVELARPNGHMALNHACLPVPALGLFTKA